MLDSVYLRNMDVRKTSSPDLITIRRDVLPAYGDPGTYIMIHYSEALVLCLICNVPSSPRVPTL